jgi:hypothetical protein
MIGVQDQIKLFETAKAGLLNTLRIESKSLLIVKCKEMTEFQTLGLDRKLNYYFIGRLIRESTILGKGDNYMRFSRKLLGRSHHFRDIEVSSEGSDLNFDLDDEEFSNEQHVEGVEWFPIGKDPFGDDEKEDGEKPIIPDPGEREKARKSCKMLNRKFSEEKFLERKAFRKKYCPDGICHDDFDLDRYDLNAHDLTLFTIGKRGDWPYMMNYDVRDKGICLEITDLWVLELLRR